MKALRHHANHRGRLAVDFDAAPGEICASEVTQSQSCAEDHYVGSRFHLLFREETSANWRNADNWQQCTRGECPMHALRNLRAPQVELRIRGAYEKRHIREGMIHRSPVGVIGIRDAFLMHVVGGIFGPKDSEAAGIRVGERIQQYCAEHAEHCCIRADGDG